MTSVLGSTKAGKGYTLSSERVFVPDSGAIYEVHFGEVSINGKRGFATATIRADSIDPSQWIDLATGEPLEDALRNYVVQAYKRIS